MQENTRIIISLLANGFTFEEVQQELHLSNQEFNSILKRIRDLGYNYSKNCNDDGTIIFKASRKLNLNPKDRIKINIKEQTLRTVFISDIHVGGPFEKPERIEMVSDYATSHDIHTIINTGDTINNYYPDQEPDIPITDPVLQTKRYLKYTPFTNHLIFYNLGGNHDYKSLIETGFDPLRYIEERRFNQIALGYGQAFIQMKDDVIALAHDLKNTNNNLNNTLIFRGHSHKYRNRDNKIIYVPALTDNYQGPYEYIPLPGFLDVEFIFFDNKIIKVDLKQLAFINNDIRLASEDTMVIRPEYQERYNKKLAKQKKK